MSYSNFTENTLLIYLMGTVGPVYVGYGTASAGEDGASAAEPAGGTGYAREAFGAYTITAVGVDTQKATNDAAITFTQATSSQGTLTHVYFYDAVSAGNFLGEVSFAELSQADINAITGTIVEFAIGQCAVSLD